MGDCVFCKIARREIPCYKVYEDEDFMAFLDVAPFIEGHTMVIPKKHYRWVWDLPAGRQVSPNLSEYLAVVKKIVDHYRRVFNDEFVASVVWGMLVEHAHIQILPRPRNLHLGWERGKLDPEKAKILLEKLQVSS